MILKFDEWLIDQQDRQDIVGELARILETQDKSPRPSRRKSDEHKNWADIVIGIAQPGHIDAFNEAWKEFLLEKQAAQESVA